MSKIGLIDVDGHAKKKKWGATIYPNLALCKIAAWHKAQGDEVVWYEPMYTGHCDKVYISKIFNFTPDVDWSIDADEVIRGGTGYDIQSKLSDEIDMMQPDYDIYPLLPKDVAYGFLTRGCPNRCKWCVVPRKEEAIDLINEQGLVEVHRTPIGVIWDKPDEPMKRKYGRNSI